MNRPFRWRDSVTRLDVVMGLGMVSVLLMMLGERSQGAYQGAAPQQSLYHACVNRAPNPLMGESGVGAPRCNQSFPYATEVAFNSDCPSPSSVWGRGNLAYEASRFPWRPHAGVVPFCPPAQG
ncbi:hypothetical protein [Ferrimonas balearica]|uniref:hypothetical protein n=1 Tax=Ferrimonas balearica TaxID=44012 RepID=UPI001C993A30|nr:hypothetical protein [Ferrimonas balearica]MBY5990798.1 hypothetical protein [Ferrimonas balearica]